MEVNLYYIYCNLRRRLEFGFELFIRFVETLDGGNCYWSEVQGGGSCQSDTQSKASVRRYPSYRGDEVGYFGISLDAERCSDILDSLKSDEVQVSVAPSTFCNTTILVGLYTSNT